MSMNQRLMAPPSTADHSIDLPNTVQGFPPPPPAPSPATILATGGLHRPATVLSAGGLHPLATDLSVGGLHPPAAAVLRFCALVPGALGDHGTAEKSSSQEGAIGSKESKDSKVSANTDEKSEDEEDDWEAIADRGAHDGTPVPQTVGLRYNHH